MSRHGDVSGRVVDQKGQPVPRATVALFPRDTENWLVFDGYRALTDEAGRFHLRQFDQVTTTWPLQRHDPPAPRRPCAGWRPLSRPRFQSNSRSARRGRST